MFCTSCEWDPYVGRTKGVKPRWSNHVSHAKKGYAKCNLAKHVYEKHKGISPSEILKFQILESNISDDAVSQAEEKWRWKLCSWKEHGGGISSKHD